MTLSAKTTPTPSVGGWFVVADGQKKLVRSLRPKEIALIDHDDLDRVSAEDLISAEAVAVLNCRASRSSEYPNMGPLLLVEAGITLIDLPDDRLFELCRDGDRLELREGEVWRNGEEVNNLRVMEVKSLADDEQKPARNWPAT